VTVPVAVATDGTAVEQAWAVSCAVADPELPLVTIGDLGIVRAVDIDAQGCVHVALTPTYSGCPATAVIRQDVVDALHAAGFDQVELRTALAPAWTTDWITEAGRRKLSDNGIVPPSGVAEQRRVDLAFSVRCPRCESLDTRLVSRFGSTACQAMYRCASCLEPFDAIKPY